MYPYQLLPIDVHRPHPLYSSSKAAPQLCRPLFSMRVKASKDLNKQTDQDDQDNKEY